MRIIFLGTPEFGSINLERMIKGGYKPELVITNPNRPAGRGKKITESHISKTAKKFKIPVIKPERVSDAMERIREANPDLMVVAAYGQYLPSWMINIPKQGIINVHPSLLPKYRGPSPIQYAIFNGDQKTGATIMLINDEMDKGDIIAQREYELSGKERYEDLFPVLTSLGADLLVETIPKWVKGEIKPVKQNGSKAIYSKILTRWDGKIDWKNDAQRIERQIRAFNPWPGAYAFFNFNGSKEERLIKVLEGGFLKQTKHGPFGPPGKTYVASNGNIAVQTGKDFLIIKRFQLDGGNPTSSQEYLKKDLSLIGLTLK